jgi:hypothetical protein
VITLHNRTRQQRTFHLEHDPACAGGRCYCHTRTVGVQDHDAKTGTRTLRAVTQRVPSAITLNAKGSEGDSLSGLPQGTISVPEIAKSIKEKLIAWTNDPEGGVPHHHADKARAQKAAAEAAVKAAAESAPPPEEKSEIQDKPSGEGPTGSGPPDTPQGANGPGEHAQGGH